MYFNCCRSLLGAFQCRVSVKNRNPPTGTPVPQAQTRVSADVLLSLALPRRRPALSASWKPGPRSRPLPVQGRRYSNGEAGA